MDVIIPTQIVSIDLPCGPGTVVDPTGQEYNKSHNIKTFRYRKLSIKNSPAVKKVCAP